MCPPGIRYRGTTRLGRVYEFIAIKIDALKRLCKRATPSGRFNRGITRETEQMCRPCACPPAIGQPDLTRTHSPPPPAAGPETGGGSGPASPPSGAP